MKQITYGPGDDETWPPCSGHPNDPRNTDNDAPGDDNDNEVGELDE